MARDSRRADSRRVVAVDDGCVSGGGGGGVVGDIPVATVRRKLPVLVLLSLTLLLAIVVPAAYAESHGELFPSVSLRAGVFCLFECSLSLSVSRLLFSFLTRDRFLPAIRLDFFVQVDRRIARRVNSIRGSEQSSRGTLKCRENGAHCQSRVNDVTESARIFRRRSQGRSFET